MDSRTTRRAFCVVSSFVEVRVRFGIYLSVARIAQPVKRD
jgi:hypothetical protein